MITAMTEILNIATTALVLLAGLAALLHYVSKDVFAGPRSEYDATDLRDAELSDQRRRGRR